MPALRCHRGGVGLLLLLLLQALAFALVPIHAFRPASPPAPRYATLRDWATAKQGLVTPADVRTLIHDEAQEPVTRCELELVLPAKDRETLLAAHLQDPLTAADKANLNLKSSLEAYHLAIAPDYNDVEATLERWRRVVAMRQNRVLNPARAAQLYSQLTSCMLCQGEFPFLRQVLTYVGLTPDVYLPEGNEIDLNRLCFHIGKTTLDIDLERWRFEEEGRAKGEPEPRTPKERGESMAEWLWQQVVPPGGRTELETHVRDMTESVLRVAFRHAKDQGLTQLTLWLQEDQDPPSRYHRIDQRGLLLPLSSLELLRDVDAASLDLEVRLEG